MMADTSNGRRPGLAAPAEKPTTTVRKGTRPGTVPEVFAEIKRQAEQGLTNLRTGHATTGSAALSKIRELADDGERWSR